jgi:hypothetical protein
MKTKTHLYLFLFEDKDKNELWRRYGEFFNIKQAKEYAKKLFASSMQNDLNRIKTKRA